MTKEQLNIRQHNVEEKTKDSSARIITHDIQADSTYQERAVYFRNKLSKVID